MNASQYLKNVGKSLGYIAIDSFKQMNPNIAAVYDNAKEFTSDLYQTIDDFKAKAVGSDSASLKSKAQSTANEVWKNARDDFLSGKWYNKERKAAADDEMLKAMGFDFDLDFDLDDFGDTESPADKSDKVQIEQSQKEAEAIIGTVNGSVASAANTIASATTRSTEYLASIQNSNTAALYDLNVSGFNSVNAGLAAVNANVSALVTLAKPLTDHMQNSATFYAKSTEFQNKALDLLTKIANNTGVPEKKSGKRKNSFEDYIGEDGINLAALFSDAKESASKTIKDYKELLAMFGGVGGLTGDIKASPISALLTNLLIPAMIPGSTKKKMKNLNKYVGTLGFTELNKLSKGINDSPFGLILDLLGVDIPELKLKNKVNTGKYNQGRTFWTGRSEKALQYVIPYYLSKMTAALDGSGKVEIFDYASGTFKTRADIQKDYDERNMSRAKSASYSFYSKVKTSGNKEVTREDIDGLSSRLIMFGGQDYYLLFSPVKKERDNYLTNHKEISNYLEGHKALKALIDKGAFTAPSGTAVNKYDLGDYARAIGEGQIATSKDHSRYEESGEFDILFNKSTDIAKRKNGLSFFGEVDKNGYSALDYLRGIYINTSGGGKKYKKKASGGVIPDIVPGVSIATAQAEAESNIASATSSYSASASDIIKDLENMYNVDVWEKISKDEELKDYLIEKQRAIKEGNEEYFQENSTLEAKVKGIKFGNSLSNAAKKFAKDTGLSQNISNFVNKMGDLATKPTEIINKAIDLVHSTLHDIIFSKAGLFGWLFDKENGKLSPVFKKIGGAFKRMMFGGPAEGIADVVPAVPTAYTGGYVRRTGLAAVSEGEMIIPAELNPYYNGPINKSRQRKDENRSIMRFFGSYANGTSNVGGGEPRQGGLIGTAANTVKQGFVDFGTMLFQLFSRTIGSNGDAKSEKKERDIVANIIGKATNEIKEHSGDAILGGMIGGGVSLLTGGVISPLFGASLGAATGLIMSSDKLKDFLFGKDDKNGKVFGAAGPKIRRFIEDQLPTSLMGGALGGVGGALLGHPVAGMFLGAGIGFISKSKGVQSFLFGETDEQGNQTKKGLISKELQDKFKKALPGMSAGAITGLVASAFGGPFGLVGNMLIGAGVGGIVTSEKFKNWFFGDKDPETGKRKGGLVQELRDRLLDPTKEMFLNLGDRIRQDFREISIGFFNKLKQITGTIAQSTILSNIKNVGGKGIDWINGKLDKLGLSLPKHLVPDLRGLSDKVKAGNLAGGYLMFDKSGKPLSAAQRLDNLSRMNISDRKRNKLQGSFGMQVTEMLAGEMNEDGTYKGLARGDLNKLFSDLNKMTGLTDEQKTEIINSNSLLSKYLSPEIGGGVLSDSEIRKLKDSVKVELGANTKNIVLQDIKNTTKTISGTLTDIVDNVRKILTDGVPTSDGSGSSTGGITKGENERSTVAGQIKAKKEQSIEEMNERTMNAIEKQTKLTQEELDMLGGSDPNANNDQETKKGGLFNKFFGKDSILGKAASIITKFGAIVGAVALGIASTGIFDDILSKLGIGLGTGGNYSVNDSSTGGSTAVNRITQFFTRNGKESTFTNPSDLTVSVNDTSSFSDRVLGMIGRQGIHIIPALAAQALSVINHQIMNIVDIIPRIPLLNGLKLEGPITDFFEGLWVHVDDLIKGGTKVGGTTLKEIIGTAAIVIEVVSIIVDFSTGMQDAVTTMKVTNPTLPEKLFCGLLRVIKNDIPFVGILGALIPDSFLFDLLMKTVGKALGLNGLQERRDQAQIELDEFNASTGQNLSWSQYAKQELGAKTWTERGWETIKTSFVRTGQSIKNIAAFSKEKGSLAGGIGAYLNQAYETSRESTANFGGGPVSSFMYNAGEMFDNILPGIMGEMLGSSYRVIGYALKGDYEGIKGENVTGFKGNTDFISRYVSLLLNPPLALAKLVGYPLAFIVNTAKGPFAKIQEGVESVVSSMSKGFDYLSSEADSAKKVIHSDNRITGSLSSLFKVEEPAEDVQLKPLFKSLAMVTRVAMIPVEGIKQVGRIASVILKPITDDFKTAFENTSSDVKEVADLAFSGHPFKLFSIKSTVSSTNPVVKDLSESVLGISKYVLSTPAMAIGTFNEAKNAVVTFINNTKTVFEGVKTDSENIKNLAFSGNFVDLLAYESAGATTGELGFDFTAGFISGLQKIVYTGIAVTGWVGQKIYKFIQPEIDAIRECADFYKGEINDTVTKIEDGDVDSLKDLLGDSPIQNPDNPGELFFNASVKIARLVALPVAAIKATGGVIGTFLNRVQVAFRANGTIYESSLETLKDYVDDDQKTLEDIIAFEPPFDTHDPTSGFRSNVFGLSKLFYGMIKMVSSFGQGIKDKIGDAWEKYKKFVNFGYVDDESGSGSGIGGGSSGFVSQIDPRFAGKNLGGYNVGAMGCGPAAASMVLGNSMNSNINLARKYQTAGGTDLAYFAEAFSRNGRRPIYYNLGGGASGADMVQDIASGRPVVLMGRDPYNTSKRFSPFGPNNHYVVARGFRNGGIVIDDPESSAGGRIYDPSILRNVRAAVSAGSSGLRRLTGIGGGSAMIGETSQQCWAFFKSKGYSDGAAAGVLANIQAESSFNTGADNPGDAAGGSHGLCQWNGSRWTALKNLARSMGKSEFDLDVQLEHLHSEIGQAGAGYTSIEDPATAAEQFCRNFERPRYPDKDSAIRRPIAIEFYNAYSGKSYSYTAGLSSNNLSALSTGIGATTQPKQETKASKFFNLVSTIGSAFTSAFTGSSFFGGNKNNESGISSTGNNNEILNNNIQVTSWPGKQPVEYMRDVLGKLNYSQTNRDPEQGGGDCSSTVAWALTKAGIPVTSDSRWQYMNNTDPYTHPSWQNVVWYDGGRRFEERNPGKNVEDLVNLKPNDVIFYSWKNSKSTYPDHVDHVEMYNGNRELIGNGGGVGTKIKSSNYEQGSIIKIARPKGSWDSASGSGLDLTDLRVTGRKENTVTRNGKVYNFSDYKRSKSSAGASGLDGGLNITKDTAILLRTMITLIESIVKNTNDISLIYRLLEANLTNSGVDKESAEAISKLVDDKNADSSRIEDSLSSLKAAVDAILAS